MDWFDLLCFDIFFNVFCYNNARFSAELRLLGFDFSKEKKRETIFYLQKFVKSSYATLAFTEVQFNRKRKLTKDTEKKCQSTGG